MLVWLERRGTLLLGLALLLLLGGLVAREATRPGPPPAFVIHAPDAGDGPVVVHVTGAVLAPGVYELQSGARVQDALLAAGGVVPDGNAEALNLARLLHDGEKLDVPSAPRTFGLLRPQPETSWPIDINTASQARLEDLVGIGEAYARRIVDSRIVDGPFASVDDLLSRRVLPAATLDAIRSDITVSTP